MKELDLVEVLRDVPKGTKLWVEDNRFVRSGYGNRVVTLSHVVKEHQLYPIKCSFPVGDAVIHTVSFTRDGKYKVKDKDISIFPSETVRDWSKFTVPKFKEGDKVKIFGTSGWVILSHDGFEEDGHVYTVKYIYKGTIYTGLNEEWLTFYEQPRVPVLEWKWLSIEEPKDLCCEHQLSETDKLNDMKEEKRFPREMMVWDDDVNDVRVRNVIGFIEGHSHPWISDSLTCEEWSLCGWKHAKEIDEEKEQKKRSLIDKAEEMKRKAQELIDEANNL